ncbi:MAG: hypothetical protein SFV19_02575 [Rhodospirillaceae bacterium]|nr:hypothetical protein [Rhodospirillaceae bacterium]
MKPIQGLFLASALAFVLGGAPAGAEDDEGEPVGYGGAKVQMQNFMVPTHSPKGQVRFEVLTLRLVLDAGPRERAACFSVPIVHEKMLMFLYDAKLSPTDLVGQRKDILAKRLLEVAINATAKGYYSGVEIVDESTLALEAKLAMAPKASADAKDLLDNKSKTLTSQCR